MVVLYRKYRPQKLEELDLESVRERLKQVLSSKYKPHAYLFAGPKGTGKTSAARIIAKMLNCEAKSALSSQTSATGKKKPKTKDQKTTTDIEPCDSCDSCQSIIKGRHIDVLEIDAASNRGIDEIRQLKEGIKLAPVSAKFKIYIIDEVHMLTKEAFNALLKTLEEPPKHAVFILATTEPSKLPDTITSRVSRFNFPVAGKREVVRCLNRVVKGEGIKITNEALDLIADTAEGSFRDATKLLEQAVSENSLDLKKLKEIFGRDSLSATNFLLLFHSKNTNDLLVEIEKMASQNVDFKFFVSEVLHLLHAILIGQHGIFEKEVSSDLLETFSTKEILGLIRVFSRVYVELRSASPLQLPLEVAVVEWCEK